MTEKSTQSKSTQVLKEKFDNPLFYRLPLFWKIFQPQILREYYKAKKANYFLDLRPTEGPIKPVLHFIVNPVSGKIQVLK